ncbi:MAG: chitobiase/beta-hexosaminidase C-terminal domain-containing protein [Chthoniobacter sp.]
MAFHDGLAPSPTTGRIITIGAPAHPPMNSFHVGNSLTGNASHFSIFLRTAGGTDDFPAYLIGGSLTVRLWNDAHGSDQARWEQTYAKAVHPLEYFTLQPRDFNVAEEADYATRFIRLVRAKSPNVQPWLYAEWVEMERQRPTDEGIVPSSEMKKTFPALSWENRCPPWSSTTRRCSTKSRRAITTANAFASSPPRSPWAGRATGSTTANSLASRPRKQLLRDLVRGSRPREYQRLLPRRAHLVRRALSRIARKSPPPPGHDAELRPSHRAAKLAWDVIKNYPDCGLYEEGSEPCGKPQIVSDGKTITLDSATSGAWFRYTLDGTTPTRTTGYIYCGKISHQPGIRSRP